MSEHITDERLTEIDDLLGRTSPVIAALVAEVRRLRAVARENLAEEDRLRKILGARSDEDELDAARRVVGEGAGLDRDAYEEEMHHVGERAEKAERDLAAADREIKEDEKVRFVYLRRAQEAERDRDEAHAALITAAKRFVAKDMEGVRLLLCDTEARTHASRELRKLHQERDVAERQCVLCSWVGNDKGQVALHYKNEHGAKP